MPVFETSAANQSVQGLERRDFLIRWARRLSCAAFLCTLSFSAFRGYAYWQQSRLENQVQDLVAKREFASAELAARRLLAINQNNLTACRARAEMAEAAGAVEAVDWRKRIARLEPYAVGNRLALARAALRFGQIDLAENVLKAMPASDREELQYHQVSGRYALARHNRTLAQTHFAAALRIQPDDPQTAADYELLRLASSDTAAAEAARVRLVELSNHPTVRLEVLRALTRDALDHLENAAAQKWASQLRLHEQANYSDALLYLHAMQRTEAAAPALEELKAKAIGSPATAAELITWLNRQAMAVVAIHWSAQLLPEIRENQPVPLAIAESHNFLQDWPGLHRHVEGKHWGEAEALRLAVESFALRRLDPAGRPGMESQVTWRAALKAAERRPEHFAAIAQLAEGWGDQAEAEEAWWLVANRHEDPRMGLSALQRLYKAKGLTRGLLRVARRALELNPNDLEAAHTCASLGLLLSNDGTSRRLAAKLHAEHPANRAVAATHAYGLHTEGKTAEALHLLESLGEEARRHSAVAAYYVIMLVENGQLDRARLYLSDAKRAALLPEEQQLLSGAASKLLPAQASGVAKR